MDFDQTLEAFFEAVKQRDLDKLLSAISFDKDVNLILPNGTLLNGKSTVTNLHAAWFADQDWQLDYTILRTIETSEMAFAFILMEYSDVNLPPSYPEKYYWSLVFTKKDGSWCLVHDQNMWLRKRETKT